MTTIATIKAGQSVKAGYKSFLTDCEFLGFSTDHDIPAFNTLAEIRSQVADKEIYKAIFRDLDGNYTWVAYFWNGRWRVGTSADTLKLAAA
jgi:hypothetical protein